ncbi:MAG: DUF4397 domain-containing protein [Actinomycetota bacterium]|nr:DUF4397 domain-containing protein [Actinomycetota bacterium]MDP9460273.1 DUF4397 domain-containing protein [Actinomycetota bacterium]
MAALVAGAGLTGGTAQAAESAGNGLLRLAHLSPDTPAVDVYVDSVAVPDAGVVMAGVAYGAVSDYQDVPPGEYTVAMREAGAQESAPPVLSTTVEVGEGTARTVAGVGLFADLGLEIIEDQLVPPQEGKARVRVLAGAANAETLDVALQDGTAVASKLRFAATSDYVDVPAGSTGLRVAAEGGDPAALPVALEAGSVYSLVVLDDADGLRVQAVLDAAGPGVVPQGGVETGVGGAAGSGSLALATLGAGATVAGVGALMLRSGRGRHRPGVHRA